MSVILDLPYAWSVWISSAVAIIYTLLGGLYSVAYTDVIQLSLAFLSLVSHIMTRSFLKMYSICTVEVGCLRTIKVSKIHF